MQTAVEGSGSKCAVHSGKTCGAGCPRDHYCGKATAPCAAQHKLSHQNYFQWTHKAFKDEIQKSHYFGHSNQRKDCWPPRHNGPKGESRNEKKKEEKSLQLGLCATLLAPSSIDAWGNHVALSCSTKTVARWRCKCIIWRTTFSRFLTWMIIFWMVSKHFKHIHAKINHEILLKIIFNTYINVYVCKNKPPILP